MFSAHGRDVCLSRRNFGNRFTFSASCWWIKKQLYGSRDSLSSAHAIARFTATSEERLRLSARGTTADEKDFTFLSSPLHLKKGNFIRFNSLTKVSHVPPLAWSSLARGLGWGRATTEINTNFSWENYFLTLQLLQPPIVSILHLPKKKDGHRILKL